MKRFTDTPDLQIKAYSVNEVVFEGAAFTVLADNGSDAFSVLPGHANLMAVLNNSVVTIDTTEGEKQLQVKSGILKVTNNQISLFITA